MMNGMIWDTKDIRDNMMEFNVGDWITTPDYPVLTEDNSEFYID